MYAVINRFPLTIPVEELRGPFEESGLPLLASFPGFRGVLCVAETEKDAALVILWDTEEDAVNGGRAIGPTWFHEHIAPYLAGEQQRSVGKVIVSRLE